VEELQTFARIRESVFHERTRKAAQDET
jgi:hypothetical protein